MLCCGVLSGVSSIGEGRFAKAIWKSEISDFCGDLDRHDFAFLIHMEDKLDDGHCEQSEAIHLKVKVFELFFFKNSELSTSCGFIFLHFGIVRDDHFLVH